MKNIFKKILYILSRSKILCKISSKIIDYCENQNNCDIETNGEAYFIDTHKDNFKVVFDVGANIGEWSNYIYKIKPDCNIYSFEPSKKTFEILQSNIDNERNKIYNIGLGDKNETITFYNYVNDSTLSSISKRDEGEFNTELADFETLDNFCEKNSIDEISFLKIDTEGNEFSVLKGSEELISKGKIKYIQFEYGGTYIDANILLKDIFDFFKNKPYKIYKIMQKDIKEIKEYDPELENFQYSNYVAILKNANN